ncbi:hypothetical protein SYNPS1DRAFT_28383 [Syncephalis pseudoplumigaleata]|uniref:Uncharacterized protein n=1 Tax=Syncephalis pseudoplumigaleata TaxID=1712513 RepID=A0A4V1J1Q7_9FUNG|nr:hypothetical protein SYNPS1DRAFT_28383 [Syncephalis pseudoplumigaleata]|eukprot:RKP25899.1 hypothetical protein SYNPS1DRAFT_28383 [Syncephalis pseudoplumigaleata]
MLCDQTKHLPPSAFYRCEAFVLVSFPTSWPVITLSAPPPPPPRPPPRISSDSGNPRDRHNTTKCQEDSMTDTDDDIYSDVDDTPLFLASSKPEPKPSSQADQWLAKLPIETAKIVKAPRAIQSKTMALHATAAKPRKAGRSSRRKTARDDQQGAEPTSDTGEPPAKLARPDQASADVGDARGQGMPAAGSSSASSVEEAALGGGGSARPLHMPPHLHRVSNRRGARPISRISSVRVRIKPQHSTVYDSSSMLPEDMADLLLEQMLLSSMQETARDTADVQQLAARIWTPKFCRQLVKQLGASFAQAKHTLGAEYSLLQQLSSDILDKLQQASNMARAEDASDGTDAATISTSSSDDPALLVKQEYATSHEMLTSSSDASADAKPVEDTVDMSIHARTSSRIM